MGWTPEPPAARPRLTREQKKQQTRAALLDAARSLFSTKGIEATTVDDIVQTAGFTRGAFYANFDNKMALVREIIAGGFLDDVAALEIFEGATTLTEIADRFQAYGEQFVAQPTNVVWMLEFQLAAMRYPQLREEYTRQYRDMIARVRSLIERYHPAFPAEYHGTAAELLTSLLATMSLQRLLDSERIDQTVYRKAFDLIILGVQRAGC